MADDREEDRPTKRSGIRKDGKPYAIDNTREDGSYTVGHKRTPVATRFAKDDGRRRGPRRKGGKNVMTDWREELSAKMAVTENGKTKKITKQRALIKAKIDRAIRKSDRAAEIALRYAEISEKREPGVHRYSEIGARLDYNRYRSPKTIAAVTTENRIYDPT